MLSGTIAALLLMLQAAPAGQSRAGAAAENPDDMICRAPEPRLGSRVARRRVCRTRAEWQAASSDNSQRLRDLERGSCGGECLGPDYSTGPMTPE